MSTPSPRESTRPQLVLLGAGHAHVHVLAALAEHPLPEVDVTLVAPHPRQMYSGMVPGFVAGHYRLEDCVIPLEPLVRRAGVRWLRHSVTALDAQARTVQLDDGTQLHYDWASVATGPVARREQLERDMPGASTHGVFIRPIESFGQEWPRIVERSRTQPLRVTVIGGGAAGIELATAVQHRLETATVTLLSGRGEPGANYPAAVRQRIQSVLANRRIQVLHDVATRIGATELGLGSGGTLACDVALIAVGAQAPQWLESSGLQLDAQGFIAVDACQRSTSHPQVFAAGDVSSRIDRPLARSGVYAVRAGPALAHNLAAAVTGQPLLAHEPPAATLNLLSCGSRYAVASWGRFSAQGRWVWLLKDWIDRRFMRRYTLAH